MASTPPGFRSSVSRRPKKATASTKRHRFESFTKRIEQLKIDPVHTVRRVKPSKNDADVLQSFFHTALQGWAELNLSATFTSFLNKASPLCENLPQVLHHADKIFEILAEHIEKRDELALEPLLSLLAQLAHDLDHGFEPYFRRTVQLVAEIAAAADKTEVVEWCFNCLAFLFKYLSKLLLRDLRPLLDIMIPYLSFRKDYIVRFSAESLSFLLRKAAIVHHTHGSPLVLAVKHLLKVLSEQEGATDFSPYQFGVMSLFVESARGVDQQLHSCAPSLVQCLLDCARLMKQQAQVQSTVDGILTALIHETTSDTFKPIQDVVLDAARESAASEEASQMPFAVRILLVIIGTQRGSRISEWTVVIEAFQVIAAIAWSLNEEKLHTNSMLAITIAAVIQYAPLDHLLPVSQPLLDSAAEQFSPREFYAFSTGCAELGPERFTNFVLPELQKYIAKHWSDDEVSLYYMLERLKQNKIGFGRSADARTITCPADFGSFILSHLSAEPQDEDASDIEHLAGRLRFSKGACLFGDSENTTGSLDGFHALLTHVLENVNSDLDLRQRTVLGWGFDTFVELAPADDPRLNDLATRVPKLSPVVFHLPAFVQATGRLFGKVARVEGVESRVFDNVRRILMRNLLSTSFSLKKGSAQLLRALGCSRVRSWLNETIRLMLDILNTPYTPADARKIAMLLRRLLHQQKHIPEDSSFQDLIPLFCCGLMPHYHDQTRLEVCNFLSQMVHTTFSEETVVNVALQWLQSPADSMQLPQKDVPDSKPHLSCFECSNLAHLDSLSSSVSRDFENSGERFRSLIENDHRLENPDRPPPDGRSLALQLLSAMPGSAERRSRSLVPIFLAAPFTRAQLQPKPGSDTSTSSHTLSPDIDDHEWSLRDRKAMLALLGQFLNPRALFRSSEVHEKLVDLLGNGNDAIRKLALQAVLTWRDPLLVQYEAILLQLADGQPETSFIGKCLASTEEEGHVRPADRDTVIPVILRLFFGIIVGRAGTSGSQDARRKSLLRILLALPGNEVSMFLDIALGKLKDVKVQADAPDLACLTQAYIPEDQQYGFLRLLLSMMETFQQDFHPYGKQVIDAVMFCVQASHQGQTAGVQQTGTGALTRNIRRSCFQCLALLFQHCHAVEWPRYLRSLFSCAISPRLDIFASETSQGISGLLRLFSTWARSPDYIDFLVDYDQRVLAVIWQTLGATSTPEPVKQFILAEFALPLADLVEDEDPTWSNKARKLLMTDANGLFTSLSALLEQSRARTISGASTVIATTTIILGKVAPLAQSPESRQSIVKLLTALLSDGKLLVPPHVKGKLLLSVQRFLAVDATLDESSHLDLLTLVSSLFNYFKDQANRQLLCDVLEMLATSNVQLAQITRLCKDVNAMSAERLDEIDYDRRLQAFQSIPALEFTDTGSIYQPIIYNLLFFLRTSDDLTIRSNALDCLKQMIVRFCEAESPHLNDTMVNSVLAVTKKCMSHESEIVRADFVTLLGLLVRHARNNGDLRNMTPLLVGNDEEASFFSNILHIQAHRRLRAIRRLVSEVEKGQINAANIVDIFIPLLKMFAYDPRTDETAQSVKGESITAIGTLLEWIDWKNFRMLFRRYKNDLDVSSGKPKANHRLLTCAVDALLSANSRRPTNSNSEDRPIPYLAMSLPSTTTVEKELRSQFIPKLADLVHYKDETEISLRLPFAVVAIKLITLLPPEEIPLLASPIILDIAQILRSRSQESRDAARKALCEIVLLLGPTSLQFVLREMRTALTKGYQLHVVSYTLHAILVALVPQIEHGALDYCCEELVSVIMDDIFGAVGQEKDNQDYVSSMKEVKSSKSSDSMELLARSISIPFASKLVAPIQIVLSGNLSAKQVRQVDELLRRIGSSLSQNPSASPRDVLTFAYQLIQSLYQQKETGPSEVPGHKEMNRKRYLVDFSTGKTTQSRNSALSYKLAKFALDLVRSTFQRSAETLTAENVHGFLPIIGDALIEGQEDVKISALRLLSAVVKLPMPKLEQDSPLYIAEAVKMVRNSTSTNEEGAQAALKFLAAILRERKSVVVRESDIAEILHRIAPDIAEPDRQGVTFNFIRAVMARKIQLPELYDLADKIGAMMVTNQSKGARDVARGLFVHFLLDYPQSSSRWSKQQRFLMTNLEYEHPEGRQSIMEAIYALVGKMKGEAAQELIQAFFIPILLRMVNDDNEQCRKLAGVLLGQLFSLVEGNSLKDTLALLDSWVDQGENSKLKQLSMQAYAILLDTDVSLTQDQIGQIRTNINKSLEATSVTDEEVWEIRFQSLQLLSKLVGRHPAAALNSMQQPLWSHVWPSLTHPNPWIQSTSANLINQFFSHCGSIARGRIPLPCDHGLSLDSDDLLGILKDTTRILRHTIGNDNLSTEVEQILLFLGQYLNANSLGIEVGRKASETQKAEEADSDEDSSAEEGGRSTRATQYLLDQLARTLRRETTILTSAALLPKKSSLRLLSNLIPALSMSDATVNAVLLPLQHLTDTNTIPPRSADPTFAATYQNLIELAHEVIAGMQKKLGDAAYVRAVTEVSKTMRERREERRAKRRIEQVAEPEKAARDKKRKSDRKKERKREMGRAHQKRRMEGGGM
ncbi:HEAT repeat containing protein [Fonsecaea pedrosoi]|nr:HEAT repeat containing protein [Fonsecaea pedrosoi]